ncbi:MAG TPA: peptide chain release factor 2, partial [Saccharofermentans sp.]|nr:peptide chain release factor 2 [Saccharofermentans sp.]
MLEYDNIRLELEGLEGPIDTLKDALHIEHVMTQISELESRTQEPDFWND